MKTLNDAILHGFIKISLSLFATLAITFFFNGIEDYGKIQLGIVYILHIIVILLFYFSYQDSDSKLAIIGLYIGVLWNIILIILMFINIDRINSVGSELAGIVYLTYEYFKSIKELKTAT